MLESYFGMRVYKRAFVCIFNDTRELRASTGRWEIQHDRMSVRTGTVIQEGHHPLLKTAISTKASPTTLNERLSESRQHGHDKNPRCGALIISHQHWRQPTTMDRLLPYDYDVDEKSRGVAGLLKVI